MNYKIVADSSANLLSFEGIPFASVPLKIVTDEKEYTDDAALDTAGMLAELAAYKGKSGTSCPNVGEWVEAFGDAERVFAVAITSNLSGCYNACVQAKAVYEEAHPGRKVCCLDSLSVGPEMALTVEKLKELIGAGLEFEEIETRIRAYMQRTHLLFMLESVDNLAKNGRVNPLIAKAVGFLGIRIVGKASDVGTLQQLHKCRGEKKGLEKIIEEMKEHGFRGGKVRIAHCFNESAANALLELVKEKFADIEASIIPMTGLCSFYAENGSVMIGFEG
ncbi:MAG: DegV family protein [Oscillospiraceae bacterium]|nr:DegV family protein [Oscillospiraceae bacterium]